MKHEKQTAAAARTGTQSASSGVSVLQSLQNENDALRSELLRVKQHKAHMQRQLHDLRAVAERTAREAAMSGKEQVRALEERCRLLADRLVGSKREEQVTETARVGFLLRSQIEERRFLKRGLEAMQEVLANVDGSAASVSRIDHPSTNASTHPEGKEPEGEVHTGDLHRLMMTVSGSLHAHTASAKLEKARIRLTLEQAASLVDELHDAVEDAARAAFDAAVQANVACDAGTTSPAGGDVFQLSSVLMVPCGAPASAVQNASSFTPAHRRGGGHDGYLAGSADAASSLRHQGAGAFPLAYSLMTPPSSAQLGLELEWVCDVLKACMKGAAEVRALIGAAAEGLRAPLPLLQRRCDAGDRSSTTEQAPPLASAASPEMNALLRSFLEDLWTLKQQAARQQEDMARQLAQEVERHFQSTQQYEQRVKLLEAECARLLFYVERQATQRPGVDATTQTSSRQNATVSETLMPALVPVQDTPVTPERYVASRDVAKLSERRSARPPRKPPVATSRVLLAGQRTPPRVSSPLRPKETQHAALLSSASHTMEVNDPARANRDTTSYYFQKGLSFSQPSSPSKPSRATAPNAPSPAASAIRSAYGDQKVTLQRPASEALRSPPRLPSQLLSPAPPLVHPKALTITSASTVPAHSLSPRRRSTTVSMPSRSRGTAPFRAGSSTATRSSASFTSKRCSPVRPGNVADSLVSSHQRTHTAAASLSSAEPRPAITAAAVPRDSTPSPSGTSVATPRPGRETSRHCTHLSQQIYSEAAADVFSFHSTTFGGAPSALSSVRHLQSESSRMSDVGSTAEVQTPSPRRPVRLSLYLNRASPGEAAVLRTARQLHTPPSPVSAVLSGHVLGDGSTVGISRQAETPSTPPIWRRIKEEASFQRQHLPSPIAGGDASSLFGTPHEVPWTNA
ncbi:hypothetical protein, conserved [Leishmania donovani]|uniref:Uncharacterized protein n=1 Tax=Leishmania donovani TaxID=5661 RepID=E9BJV5_LEIDO|nr:hypothetical protein, conserved [Leishmania donovani]TPP54362.1 hypothetical protein CGC21_22605 [Leishmania donovani]CBZ35639.1 hypothetical protein, conserved [Leishmania donovani]